ncbi:MAG TPA: anthranilate phosphoribosyltransferase [Bacteroidales bacterium]|nr:anthranilate phosphoribosyltransferase [Bacteroidales bacterium]
MKNILHKLIECRKLTSDESFSLMQGIAKGEMNDAQIAAVLTSFIMRSLTIDELSGFRKALIELAVPINLNDGYGVDLCGTGGDGKNTFNISTAAAFVTAGAGYPVIKHGNYGATAISGSSNVLEHLGYKFSSSQAKLQNELDKTGICFLHAPLFHPALKAVGPIRKQLGIRTFFNMLGPLVNPANPLYQVSGVFSPEAGRVYSYFLQQEKKNFIVLHSLDGYDEISLTSPVKLFTQQGETLLDTRDLGFLKIAREDISGGSTIERSSEILMSVLENRSTKAQQSVVIANAAVTISCIDNKKSLRECVSIAHETIISGKASAILKKLISMQ